MRDCREGRIPPSIPEVFILLALRQLASRYILVCSFDIVTRVPFEFRRDLYSSGDYFSSILH